MVSKLFVALAGALLLGSPVVLGIVSAEDFVPPSVVTELYAFVEVVNDLLVEEDWPMMEEQVVEGHTTYAVITRQAPPEFNIEGFVHCDYGVEGIRFSTPPTFRRAFVECRVGNYVFATPDSYSQPSGSSSLDPTGRILEVTDPQGRSWVTHEFSYDAVRLDPDGSIANPDVVTAYAWRTELSRDVLVRLDGSEYNFAMKIPRDRLESLGTATVSVNPESALWPVAR